MNKSTVKKKQITLEMIWELLQEQSKEAIKSQWLTLMAFAASIVIAGGILLLTAKDPGIFVYGIVFFIIMFIMYARASKKLK